MYLPEMPYVFDKKKREIISFKGLNRTPQHEDGQLSDSVGLSTAMYPYLEQSKPFAKIEEYTGNISDVFEWNNALAVVQDNMLYYDGKPVCNVQPGKKQFAVVNTKLCVFPDKIMVDIKEGSVEQMQFALTASAKDGDVELNETSIKVTPRRDRIGFNLTETISRTGTQIFAQYRAYTYGNDKASIESCFRNGEWIGLDKYEELKDVCYNDTGLHIQRGDIFIPRVISGTVPSFKIVVSPYTRENGVIIGGIPDKTLQNNEGYYCVITDYEVDLDRGAQTKITYNVYKTDGADVLFKDHFELGEAVSISGTPYGLQDTDNVIITGIDAGTNALLFDEGSVRDVYAYYIMPNLLAADTVYKLYCLGAASILLKSSTAIDKGQILYVKNDFGEGKTIVYLWDEQAKKVIGEISCDLTDNWGDPNGEMTEYTLGDADITIERRIPDLDYICESENRLWGVSNADGTIYASELGLPQRFYSYGDLSTDSYAVAVGSEDEFTAICSYGGGVCCFKETKLHKILGSYPAEYYMNEYEIAGVQKGSERSLVIINEVLYYKGKHGVYAYGGGTPQLISYALGDAIYSNASAATDGKAYYVGMESARGGELLTYDILHGMWMCQGKQKIDAICLADGKIHTLCDEKIYRQEDSLVNAEWSAEFAPMDEVLWEKKGYSKLMIKTEMQKGSHLHVYIKENNGLFKLVYTKAASKELMEVIPLRIGRCDRFSVKIEGKGGVSLRGMLREFAESKR